MDPVFVYNVAKAATGAVQHFAVATTSVLVTGGPSAQNLLDSVKIFPNPAQDFVQIEMLNLNNNPYTFILTDAGLKVVI